MLSRIAESLFWLGRYVERAEDTARILDVHYHLLLEDRIEDEAAASATLLGAMGIDAHHSTPDIAAATRLLAFDAEQPGSIVGSISAAWRNARSTREVLSSELWEAVNATYVGLSEQIARTTSYRPHSLFAWVKERTAVIAGLTDSTMSHDDEWRFLVLGRSLERVDMTARLLSTRGVGPLGESGWITTLRSCGAHEAYLLTNRSAVDASRAAEFLLLDRRFPRSIFCALGVAEQRLAELAPGRGRAGPEDDARRALGRTRAELEFLGPEEILDALPERLAGVQTQCAEASLAVGRRYFPQEPVARWVA
jgi:uncharacterized alpha-E superfamily protein